MRLYEKYPKLGTFVRDCMRIYEILVFCMRLYVGGSRGLVETVFNEMKIR